MTDRVRIAITVATALIFGAVTYGEEASELDLAAVGLVLWGLAVFGVFLVYRWWALLPGLVPGIVLTCLYVLTDHSSPDRQEIFVDLSDQPFLFLLLMGLGAAIEVASLAVGLLLRALWEWVRSRRRRVGAT
jgi:hypothetical protein